MALKAYNNGIRAKEIRCVDAGGVERIIREIRKGDEQWWRGEFDPPTIQGTWTKVSDGLYQTKAVIPSYTTPGFLDDAADTNYVIVSFHSYENTVTCEFFGDFEGLTPQNADATNGLSGNFYVTYSWTDASGNGEQTYKCNLNVFPRSNGMVTECQHRLKIDPTGSFIEDSSFVNSYGSGWVVQGADAHNKMCSDAYGYYSETTVDPWGLDGRTNDTWYNWTNLSTQVVNYICANNGRAFSVKVLSGSVSLMFCPPGGSAAGWVSSEDSKFPSSSGWYQKTKKDGYTKFFNVNNGRFAEYLPKESFRPYLLEIVRSSIGSNLSASEYENRVVCTYFNTTHLETASKVAEGKTNSNVVSIYDTEYWFDVYSIPLVNLSTGEYIFGHYNPSVPFLEFTIDGTSCKYSVTQGSFFDAVITMTFSNGNTAIGLELNQDWGFNPNTFLTSTYPQAKYMYAFDASNTDYVALLIACIADNGTDVVGDFHEYRLPTGATYELKTYTTVANGTSTSFNPTSGYVLGTGYFSEIDDTFKFVIRPSSLIGTYYHQIVFNHTNVATSANNKYLEISANLSYFGTTTYSKPQESISENKRLVPVYWIMGSNPDDRANQSYDGSRYMTSSKITYPITLTMDWCPGEVFTDDWWNAYYVLPIATSSPMTVAKAKFMCDVPDSSSILPGFGSMSGLNLSGSITDSSATFTNGVLTITMDRATGVISMTSTAKNNIPGYTENPGDFVFYTDDDRRWLHWKSISTNAQGWIDMATGTLD